MVVMKKILMFTPLLFLSSSCDLVTHLESRAQELNSLEDRVADLVIKNRELQNEINRLNKTIAQMESEAKFSMISASSKSSLDTSSGPSRSIASVAAMVPGDQDHVKFDIYKWTPTQIKVIAESEFNNKNYEKAAQFYQSLSVYYKDDQSLMDDAYLFKAGVAAYESGRYPQWTMDHMSKLVREYPTSPYYRGAKLWMALTHLKMGQEEKFFETVEEFRKKYRNTNEWKILSKHYEKIVQEFKK